MMKTGTRNWFVIVLSVMVAVCFAMMMIPISKAKAYDGKPGEFGDKVGDAIEHDSNTYVNYQGGYMKFAGTGLNDPNPTTAAAHIGGKNFSSTANSAEMSATVRDFIANGGQFRIDDNAIAETRMVYGSNWTETTKQDLVSKFKAKYVELYDAGYNCGVPLSSISAWRHNNETNNVTEIKMDFRYGDGTAYADDGGGGRKNTTTMIYNVIDDTIRLLNENKIYQMFENEHRRLGAPLTEFGTITLKGNDAENVVNYTETATVQGQVFETGVIYIKSDGNAQKLECFVMEVGVNSYEISPAVKDQDIRHFRDNGYHGIGNVDGTWHPLKTGRNVTNQDGTITAYFNFVPGCVEVVYNSDFSLKSSMRYSGYNFVKNGETYEKVLLPIENFAFKDELLWEGVGSDAINQFKASHPSQGETELKAVFRDAYKALAGTGFAPGYRCSSIKTWDGVIVLDFKYSDGISGFDSTGSAGRERMTTFGYSPDRGKAFGMYNEFFNMFKADGSPNRKNLGAPTSNVLKAHTFNYVEYAEIQFFEQGHVYMKNGVYTGVVGITSLDADYAIATVTPAPEKPGQYGAKKDEKIDGKVTYINYEYGAIKATQNAVGTNCVYEFFHGRNFNFDDSYKVNLLSIETFLGVDGNKIRDGISGTANNASLKARFPEIKKLIVAKFTEYYNKGFFIGFVEDSFKEWNSSYGQQFVWGDSSANPFGEGRKGVSYVVYNKLPSQVGAEGEAADKVFLVTNRALEAWGGALFEQTGVYGQLGKPTSDAYQMAGMNVWFQDFEGVTDKALVVYGGSSAAFYTNGKTAAQYVEEYKNNGGKPSDDDIVGREDETTTEKVEKDVPGCGASSAVSGGGLVVLLGMVAVVAAMLILRKKKNNS